ncbi:MAG: hypothetical protein MZV63_67550 [Marinilabiliales bacterium]|nr:hypothetical protein [Marinilabiliales bacterium]
MAERRLCDKRQSGDPRHDTAVTVMLVSPEVTLMPTERDWQLPALDQVIGEYSVIMPAREIHVTAGL